MDLRKKEEFKNFHIKGAKNIFWLNILKKNNLAKLSKYKNTNKIIFLICYLGHTSSQIMVILKLLGYNVVSIKFGYGISPIKNIPIAGWLQYNYPIVK